MSKTIFITGSSTGIGKATAKLFQQKGWNVVATMRTPEKETELNTLDNVLVTKLDVQDLDSITAAVNGGIEKFGTIDVVLNNAGYGLMGTFESISRESITRQFDVNVFGLFDVTRAVLPHFRKNNAGMFINVTSVGGKVTFPFISPYHATKFAVEGFSESLSYEMEAIGVVVKILEPGAVATDFGSRSLDMQHNQDLSEKYNALLAKTTASFQSRTQESISTPDMTAEVIYTAATDGSKQLRYIAGADAEKLIQARKAMEDKEFQSVIKKRFGAE